MPQVTKLFKLDITPEQFLNNCSPEELIEVELLISKAIYRSSMNKAQIENE